LDRRSPRARREAIRRLVAGASQLESIIDNFQPRIVELARQRGLNWAGLSDEDASVSWMTSSTNDSATEVEAIVVHLSTYAEHVQVQGRSGWIPQDPDDDKFIDTALTSYGEDTCSRTTSSDCERYSSFRA
jgi:hypothetical protein